MSGEDTGKMMSNNGKNITATEGDAAFTASPSACARVSIIVPVYNAEKYIEETIQSVIAQTFTDWELILVDDVSTDGTREKIRGIIAEYSGEQSTKLPIQSNHCACLTYERSAGAEEDSAPEEPENGSKEDATREEICSTDERIRLICKNRNEGAASARNTGLDAVKGRFIAFLDADDIWKPEKLQLELDYMSQLQSREASKDAGFVFCAYEFGDEKAVPTGRGVRVPDTISFRQALTRTVIFTSTVLFDTERIPKDLLRMPSIGSEDTATWWKILKSGHKAYGLNEPLVIYRRPEASLSSNKRKAVQRIWNLYRNVAGLSAIPGAFCLLGWAWRATLRRVVPTRW